MNFRMIKINLATVERAMFDQRPSVSAMTTVR
jgi:hypothetical protein